MVYLTRRMSFSASHRLWSNQLTEAENYAIYEKCANPNGHGHNYVLEVTIRGIPDPRTGMVLNLTDLKHTMNELVVKFWERLADALPTGMLYEVKLHETENNLASYRGER